MKPSVYIETTIVSYLTCRPSRDIVRLSHEIITQTWWQTQRPRFDLCASRLVIEEASAGDPTAAAERLKALEGIALLPVEPPAFQLAERLAHVLALPTTGQGRCAARRDRRQSKHGIPADLELSAFGQRRANA